MGESARRPTGESTVEGMLSEFRWGPRLDSGLDGGRLGLGLRLGSGINTQRLGLGLGLGSGIGRRRLGSGSRSGSGLEREGLRLGSGVSVWANWLSDSVCSERVGERAAKVLFLMVRRNRLL